MEREGKKLKGAKCVAALEDEQMLEDKILQSLCPDIDMQTCLPEVSQQSIGSILTHAKNVTARTTSSPGASANAAPSEDQSPSPSPIPSLQYHLAPALVDTKDGTDRDELSSFLRLDTTTKSEGTTDSFAASKSNEGSLLLSRTSVTTELEDFDLIDMVNGAECDVAGSDATSSHSEYKGSDSEGEDPGILEVVKGEQQQATEEGDNKDEQFAEHDKAPKAAAEVKPDITSLIARKRKELEADSTGEQCILIHATLIAMLLVDQIEMPEVLQVKRQELMVDLQKTPEIMLKNTDKPEIDIKKHAKKLNWKNRDLPFQNFMRDLPIWQ
ncbi:hypothetical protein IW262DRAFT_1299283 [Armillaria fumosa]|nr:hypothetical protein IW262DRAFT_1299283 [Armillaria fumosa]